MGEINVWLCGCEVWLILSSVRVISTSVSDRIVTGTRSGCLYSGRELHALQFDKTHFNQFNNACAANTHNTTCFKLDWRISLNLQ